MLLRSPLFGTGIRLRIDHWFGFLLLMSAWLQKSRMISSTSHLFNTSGGIPSSPKLFPSFTAALAFWYSSVSNASVRMGRSSKIIGICSSSCVTVGGFPSSCWKWSYQLLILSSLVAPFNLPLLDFFLPLISFTRSQAILCWWCLSASSNSLSFLSRYCLFAAS